MIGLEKCMPQDFESDLSDNPELGKLVKDNHS